MYVSLRAAALRIVEEHTHKDDAAYFHYEKHDAKIAINSLPPAGSPCRSPHAGSRALLDQEGLQDRIAQADDGERGYREGETPENTSLHFGK